MENITFIQNSREEFVSELEEMFSREVQQMGYGLGDDVLIDEANKQGYAYIHLGDETLFKLFGTVEAYRSAVKERYREEKNKLIKKIDYAICMMAAAGRINKSIRLYPNYDPSDTTVIANEIVESLEKFYSEDTCI